MNDSRARMIAARRHIIVVVVDKELRFAALQLIVGGLIGGRPIFRIHPALPAQLLQRLRPLFECHAVVVALRHRAGHVIHGAGDDGLDAFVHRGGVQCHPAPAADADEADPLAVDGRMKAEEVDRGAEVLGIDVGGCDVARFAAALAGVGRIERQGGETAFGHRLGVKP